MRAKNHKKHLIALTEAVTQYLTALDAVMKEESTFERDRKIAKLSNALDVANDVAMHFGLDYGCKKIRNIKGG